MTHIAFNILTLLQKHNLSQRQLALLANIPTSTLNDNLNQHSPFSMTNLEKIARVFHVPLDTLLQNQQLEQFWKEHHSLNESQRFTLDDYIVLFLKADTTLPSHFNVNKPFLLQRKKDYGLTDWIVYQVDSHYYVQSFTPQQEVNIIGKIIGQIDVI
ncbi:helix-turn-helix transcriptional regulator [Carnobacteriaceae bacterium zg-C25]|nr:helix-turn-helix transcriptional regulator [Carnobacteriaceae bacterium zg-C25]